MNFDKKQIKSTKLLPKQEAALQELMESESMWIKPELVATVCGINIQVFRDTARNMGRDVGVDAIHTGNKILIPRVPFLKQILSYLD